MKFIYSPQRSSNSRTEYFFDTENQKITVIYKLGKEVTERINGVYIDRFSIQEEQQFEINLNSIEDDIKKTPIAFITEYFFDEESKVNLKLLKQYGTDENNDFVISFPDWNTVPFNAHDYEIKKTTIFSEFEKLIHIWRNQLNEILCQTYNLCIYIDEEYKKINNNTPPFGSPISIRSFKSSVLQNAILYIEATANFLVSIAVAINSETNGAPLKKEKLCDCEIDKLLERKKYIRLEDKLIFSAEKISFLLGINIAINKDDNHWSTFKRLKKTRDSLTHVKIENHTGYINPSLDSMLSSKIILDKDLFEAAGVIYWLNTFIDELFSSIPISDRYHNGSFNTHATILLLKVTSSINSIPIKTILKKYKITDTFLL